GSYGLVQRAPTLGGSEHVTVTALIQPTLPDISDQVLLATRGREGPGFALGIGPSGVWFEVAGAGGQVLRSSVGFALEPRRWHRVWASCDLANGRGIIGQALLDPKPGETARRTTELAVRDIALDVRGPLTIAARPGAPPSGHFNGRIEDPAILADQAGADV